MEMEQLDQLKQQHEESLAQQLRMQQLRFEQQLTQMKEDHSKELAAAHQECSEMRRQRDLAI